MSLVRSWTRKLETSGTSKVGAADVVEVGRLLVVAVTVNNNIASMTMTDSKGNTYASAGLLSNASNLTTSLFVCKVTSALGGADTQTVTLATTASRFILVAGVFDDIPAVAPVLAASTAAPSTQAVSASLSSTGVARHLTLSAVGSTGAGCPIAANGNTVVDQIVTSAGSADRGVALLYEYETDGNSQGRATLAAAAVSVIVAGALEATPLAPTGGVTVVIAGVKKTVASRSVIVGGVKKTVTSVSVIVGGVKKPVA